MKMCIICLLFHKHICVLIFADMTGVKEGFFSIRVTLNGIFLKVLISLISHPH